MSEKRSIKSNRNKKRKKLNESIASEKIGHILASTPPIAERILNCLSIPELNRCAQVCKLWNSLAQLIKKKRYNIFWMFQVTCSNQFVDLHIDPSDPVQVYASKNSVDVGDHFSHILNNAPSDPKFGMLFFSKNIFKKPQKFFPQCMHLTKKKTKGIKKNPLCKTRESKLFLEFIRRKLPPKCTYFISSGTGIIGTPINGAPPVEVEYSLGISAVFFPTIPGIDVHIFSIMKEFNDSNISKLTRIDPEKDLKCLLLFLNLPSEHNGRVNEIIDFYINKQKHKLALGGIIVECSSCPNVETSGTEIGVGIGFTGEGLSAASIVIKSEDEVEPKLKSLKNYGFSEDMCCAFMFVCCARGADLHGESNIEADIFHRLFPSVPLFGMFGEGEIGVDSIKNCSELRNLPPKRENYWFHCYSSVFVLLSMKRPTKLDSPP